jgi:prevent-host-death family protein
MREWPLQEAKNKFSALVNQALAEGPQWVTRRGQKAVVVISAEEYERVTKPKKSFKAFLRTLPLGDLDLRRDDESDRDARFDTE